MAHRQRHLDQGTLSCFICKNLLKDPVLIPCGHSFCRSCIKKQFDEKEIYSCPCCTESFGSRPELLKNTTLAAVVEQLRNAEVQDAPADDCYAGAEDVACDVCTGRKLKALKSCLICVDSFCENHLQRHYHVARFKKHQLVEPSKHLQDKICSTHYEVMRLFCRKDERCICYLCALEEHNDHNIVTDEVERREKQKKLPKSQQTVQKRIKDKERDMKVLQKEVTEIKHSAQKAVEHSSKINAELICLMQKGGSDVKQKIKSQEEAEVKQVTVLQEKLEQEITKLKTKDAELQQLEHTEDHCLFLQRYPSVTALPGSTHTPGAPKRPRYDFKDVTAAVSESSNKIKELLKDTWTNISEINGDFSLSEPKTRAQFLRYSCDITLDPSTANIHMSLSEGNRKAEWTKKIQSYPKHQDRFMNHCQVLSKETLTGRCYWEVKITGQRFKIAVAYKNISKAGDASRFGHNDKSWALDCSHEKDSFMSNNASSAISGPWSSTVGVYLDHSAGLLSFYGVSDTMTLLHKANTKFAEPLHAGLWLFCDTSAELVKLM